MHLPSTIFPTTTIFIDDDGLYARLVAKNLGLKHGLSVVAIEHLTIENSMEERDFLFFNKTEKSFDKGKYKEDLEWKTSPDSIELDGCASVIIADLYMPDQNGLQLLEKIKSPFIYKILISNRASDDLDEEVNRAINNKIIDASLDKRKEDFYVQLANHIKMGKKCFFSKISNYTTKAKKAAEPELSKVIWDILEQINPAYLETDTSLRQFITKNGNKKEVKTIFIDEDDTINELLDSYQGQRATESVKTKLRSKNYLLACKSPFEIPGEQWGEFLSPARLIKGRSKHFLISIVEQEFYDT